MSQFEAAPKSAARIIARLGPRPVSGRASIRAALQFATWAPILAVMIVLSSVVVPSLFPKLTFAEETTSRKLIDVSAGKGFIGRKVQRRMLMRQVHGINWVEAKLHLSETIPGMNAIGIQFGTQQTEEITKNALCRTAPSIAGRIYCSTADSELAKGPQYTAVYGGVLAELVELAMREPKALRLYAGAGISRVQSVSIPSGFAPYSAFEISYELKKQLTTKAGVYVSPIDDDSKSWGVAMPSVSVTYYF